MNKMEEQNKYKEKIVDNYNKYKETGNGVFKFEYKSIYKQYVSNTNGTMTLKEIIQESRGV